MVETDPEDEVYADVEADDDAGAEVVDAGAEEVVAEVVVVEAGAEEEDELEG